MAEAFEAVREGPGGFRQRLCVKRILPRLGDDDETRRLFSREARLIAELRHRNITRVLDYGEVAAERYLALELVEGVDLRALLRSLPDRRLPEPLAALVGLEVAEALEHAHERGIVHRDVSPANILVSVDGEVKLTDFGIGKPLSSGPGPASVVRGNLWYMAPERLEPGAEPSTRADLFSLGVVLFECLAGARPYGAPMPAMLLRGHADPSAPLRALAPEVSEALEAVVTRSMAFDPEARFRDAGALVDRLTPIARGREARRALGELVRRSTRQPTPAPRREVRPRWKRYALAPRRWADAEQAARMRSPESEPPPAFGAPDATTRDGDTLPALPPAVKAGWIACGVAVSCVATLALAVWLALGS
ncbi:MAG: serine/threonine protein kinase [Sandaracinaceae bacterium]|nr:serine/threonine protein kinase [Sandaracinaceae bacterium]